MKTNNKAYFYLGNDLSNCLGTNKETNQYDNNDYVYDINNKNDAHASIARIVNKNSTVLDVGCATGITGKLLHDFKECSVDGIELDETAIKIAGKNKCYDNLYNFSITDLNNENYQEFFNDSKKYDYIIFCDVLEHLVDPDLVIVKFLKKLDKNGKLLISIPNIANIDIIRALINGEFNYSLLGILDKTHLRFFSTSSFVEMINNINVRESLNLNVKLCDQIRITPLYVREESELFKLFNLNGDLQNFLVLQNIFEISISKKGDSKNKPCDANNHNYFELMNDYLTEAKHKEWDAISSLQAENDKLRKKLSYTVEYQIAKLLRKLKRVLRKKKI